LNQKQKAGAFTISTVAIALLIVFSLFFGILLTVSSPLDKTIIKEFLYTGTDDPISGLTVDLYNDGMAILATDITNATGHVRFEGLNDGTYSLKWMWGGVEDCEEIPIDCSQLVWELTNYLASKSGGEITLG